VSIRLFGTDITFESPWAFALLALVLVALALELRRERVRPAGMLFSSLGLLPSARSSWRVRMRWLMLPLRVLGVTALITALAAPAVIEASYDIPAEGIDIVLAIDTSSSMTQRDFGTQTRMDATKRVVIDFLAGLKNDRAGIVIFSAEAMVLSPLTLDYQAAQRLVQPVEAGKLLRDGTAIGTGLATALNVVRGSTARSKVVVLLTDGSNNTGDIQPIDAAQIAKTFGIRVYTIGAVGKGLRPNADVDEPQMRQMAAIAGGQYYRVDDETALRSVYAEIEALEKARVGSRGFIETHDATLPFLALGAGLLLTEVLLVTTVFRRTP
jgi:Ca-activated chloride channel family protein